MKKEKKKTNEREGGKDIMKNNPKST